jgi:aspartate kinase
MIVMKFGGSSVQDAVAINRVAEIVSSKLEQKPVVVVSAMARVTDALLSIARTALDRRFGDAAVAIDELKERHLATARELMAPSTGDSAKRRANASGSAKPAQTIEQVETAIREQFAELEGLARSVATLGELTARSKDAIASFGERLSSLIVAAAFQARGLAAEVAESRGFVITDSSFGGASPNMAETERLVQKKLLPRVELGLIPVAQGFIGSTQDGITTTIGRGGGDYSAAIIGAALGADAIEIWTDVDGLMTADPRIVPEARRIREISFTEAAELSYFGAKVLHPSTVLPALERSIPVHIYNTRNPSCEGTVITARPQRSRNTIKSLAFKRGVTILNITSTRMLQAYGFLRSLFEVFERHQTPVDVVTTSEVSISVTLDCPDRLESITRDLQSIGEISIDEGKAIVCVVGDNLKFTPGVAAKVFSALGDINVNMISQGASEINLTFVINESEVEQAARLLHREFFSEPDPAVFG